MCETEQPSRKTAGTLPDDITLWTRIVTGVLAPQVDYELANAAALALRTAELFPCRDYRDNYELSVATLLSRPVKTSRGHRRYRFPNRAAHMLGRIHSDVYHGGLDLRQMLAGADNPAALRKRLTRDICGFGPKQATMFLRDCGITDELAIIDRHVIAYMCTINLIESTATRMNEASYYKLEAVFLAYAEYVGVSAGLLDWAIWLTMRAARTQR
jgi:N-glycosylase/DNA lyase